MTFLTVILLSISANVDNFTIAMAYGVRRSVIVWRYNLLISVVTGIGTYISMVCGQVIAIWFTQKLAADLGALLLIGIGCWFWLEDWHKRRKGLRHAREARYLRHLKRYQRGDGQISGREAMLLALLLSVNNLGSGIGASMMGVSAQVTALAVCLGSMAAIMLGQYLGKGSAAQSLGRYASGIAGGILVLLGLSEMLR